MSLVSYDSEDTAVNGYQLQSEVEFLSGKILQFFLNLRSGFSATFGWSITPLWVSGVKADNGFSGQVTTHGGGVGKYRAKRSNCR